MKRYNGTTYSMKDQKLPLSRRHFVAAAGLSPLAFGVSAALAPTTAHADVMTIREGDNVLGDTKAPLGIVEYASLTCPHCANFHKNTFPKLQKDFIDTGKAYLVYRDYPLDRYAFQASVLAHTAGEKRFFGTLKILFEKQKEWSSLENPTEGLMKIAKLIGVPQAKFEAALQDQKLGESILMDRMVGANEYGVQSTPTLFLNGERFEGNWEEYESFAEYLNKLIG
jgi:protein-disulfide isomerase